MSLYIYISTEPKSFHSLEYIGHFGGAFQRPENRRHRVQDLVSKVHQKDLEQLLSSMPKETWTKIRKNKHFWLSSNYNVAMFINYNYHFLISNKIRIKMWVIPPKSWHSNGASPFLMGDTSTQMGVFFFKRKFANKSTPLKFNRIHLKISPWS